MKGKKFISIVLVLSLISSIYCLSKLELFTTPSTIDIESKIKQYENILSKEEKKQWRTTKIDTKNAYLQLQIQIPISSDRKRIVPRIINPPYCQWDYKVIIKDTNKNVLYTSTIIPPATIINEVELLSPLAIEEQKGVVEYFFYDADGQERGKYIVNIEFINML